MSINLPEGKNAGQSLQNYVLTFFEKAGRIKKPEYSMAGDPDREYSGFLSGRIGEKNKDKCIERDSCQGKRQEDGVTD